MHDSDLPGEAEPAGVDDGIAQVEHTERSTVSTDRVADALGVLAGLDETPLSGHPDIYQGIHAELQGALADIDDA